MIPQSGTLSDTILNACFTLLKGVPTEWASAIGSFGYRMNGRLARKDSIESLKRNFRLLRPEASAAELEGWVDDFYDAVGRVAGEFAVIHRFWDEGRIEVVGAENLTAVAGKRPLIGLCLHTGNWEVFAPVFQKLGVKLNSIIQFPASPAEAYLVDRARRTFGVSPILPDLAGIRQAMRVLSENGVVSMFPDEARKGQIMAPLFGRPPHDRGNLAVAVRLARRTGALLGLGYCQRTAPCRFRLNMGETFELPARETPDLLADVAFLNEKIEPVIRQEMPRWYFMDDRIETPAA